MPAFAKKSSFNIESGRSTHLSLPSSYIYMNVLEGGYIILYFPFSFFEMEH